MLSSLLGVALVCLLLGGRVQGATVLGVDFNNVGTGRYTASEAEADFGDVTWDKGLDEGRASIIKDGSDSNRWLRVTYPRGKTGSQSSGTQIKVKLPRSYDELYTSYRVRFGGFNGDFTFVKGGKLPGLCGGDCPTGGKTASGNDGFSARMMWRGGGDAVQYVYWDGMAGTYGDNWYWNVNGQRAFPENQWVTVETRVKLNTLGQSDGVVESWWNGQLALRRQGLVLRTSNSWGINYFYFSTFFGGSGSDWAPPMNCVIDYDNIMVTTTCQTCSGGPPLPPPRTRAPQTPAPRTPAPSTPAPHTPAPRPPATPGKGKCSVRIVVEKVKDYYTRVTPTPLSAIKSIVLTKASKNTGGSMKMSYSWRDYEASTGKMTSDRRIVVTLEDGSSETFNVPYSPRPQADAVLECLFTSSTSPYGNMAPAKAQTTSNPPVMLAKASGRVKLEGSGFAPLLTGDTAALKAAVEADLAATAGIDTSTLMLSVTKMNLGSLVVDFDVTVRPDPRVSTLAAIINEKELQWALDEASATDSGAVANGDTTATLSFPQTAALYNSQAGGAPDIMYLAKGVTAPNTTYLEDQWLTHNDGTPLASSPNPEAPTASGCNSLCMAAASGAVGLLVAVIVGVAVVTRKKSATQGADMQDADDTDAINLTAVADL